MIPQSPPDLSWPAILRAESEEGAAISRSCARVPPPRDCFVASLLAMTAPNPLSPPLAKGDSGGILNSGGTPLLRRVYDQTLGPPQADHSRGTCPRENGACPRGCGEAGIQTVGGGFRPPEADSTHPTCYPCHSREGGNPEGGWIPSQARNDILYSRYADTAPDCSPFSEPRVKKARQSLVHALASHHPEIASSLRSSQ